jgi:hypothetical protein
MGQSPKKCRTRTKGLLFVISGSYVKKKKKTGLNKLLKKIIPGNFQPCSHKCVYSGKYVHTNQNVYRNSGRYTA